MIHFTYFARKAFMFRPCFTKVEKYHFHANFSFLGHVLRKWENIIFTQKFYFQVMFYESGKILFSRKAFIFRLCFTKGEKYHFHAKPSFSGHVLRKWKSIIFTQSLHFQVMFYESGKI